MSDTEARVVFEDCTANYPEYGLCSYSRIGFCINDHVFWTGLRGPYTLGDDWQRAKTLAVEIASRWNAGDPASASFDGMLAELQRHLADATHQAEEAKDQLVAIGTENVKLKKALRRAREWGLSSKNFHGGISFELGAWVDAGMGDPLPKLRDELDEEDVND